MSENNKNSLKINYWFLMAVSGFMLIGGLVCTIFFLRTNALANKNIAAAAEAKRPANLEWTAILDESCQDCFDLNPVLDYLKKANTNLLSQKNLDKNSEEGKNLIEKYAIKKLPTFLLKGELEKNSVLAEFFSKTGNIEENTFVFRQVGAPYVMTDTNAVKGRVNFTLLTDITCTECYDVAQHEIILKQFGITTPGIVLDTKSAAGQALLRKYNIKLVPTFVLSGDMNEYPSLKPVWEQVGVIAGDGAYVFTKGVPLMGTYKDLTTNKVISPPTQSAPKQ